MGQLYFQRCKFCQSNNKVKVAKAEHDNLLKYTGTTGLIYLRKLILGYVCKDYLY